MGISKLCQRILTLSLFLLHFSCNTDGTENPWLLIDDIRVGYTLTLHLYFDKPSSPPKFLDKQEADSIPFSSSALPYLLQLFSIPEASKKAKEMEFSLSNCEDDPAYGEDKTCATSFESLLDFVSTAFGKKDIRLLTTTHNEEASETSTNHTIVEAKEIPIHRMMGCHLMRYPYAVYFCHYQVSHSENKVFKILLQGNKGGYSEAVVVCHMNTSKWGPDHVSFQILNTKPGMSPVCHIFIEGDFVWVVPAGEPLNLQ